MAKTKMNAARSAASSAASVGSNEYVRRLVEGEDLRNEVRDALDHARSAYDRLANGKSPVDTVIDDKKLHKDLKTAAENLRDASERLRGKQKSSPLGKLVLLAAVGAVLAVVLSEDLRKSILDKLFGAEEEFEYTSTTAPVANGSGSQATGATAGQASS